MKQEAPTSFLPPEASQLKPDRQQFQSRKRPYEENRGRGYFEHREDRRWVCEVMEPLFQWVSVPVAWSPWGPLYSAKGAELFLPLHICLVLQALIARFSLAKLLLLPSALPSLLPAG